MTQDFPKISVVMPVLNRVSTIEKAIRSVVDQHYPNLEFIVIDGGSTDGTVEVIKRYENHIAYWHSQPDKSPGYAANMGIEKASGDVVALLMADDWYEPETLSKIGMTLKQNPSADMISCGGRIVCYDKKNDRYRSKFIYSTKEKLKLSLYNICFVEPAICCRFVKKSVYTRIGAFNHLDNAGNHLLSNDKEFLIRCVLHGVNNVYVDYLGHTYFANAESSTFGNHWKNILRLCQEQMNLAERFLKRFNISRKQKLFFIYWYGDQSTRLVLYKILEGSFPSALKIVFQGIKKFNVLWPALFLETTCKIIIKRAWRVWQKVYTPLAY